MTQHWTTPAKAVRCDACGEWIILGVMLSGRVIALSTDVFTPRSFVDWAWSGRRPVYTLVNGGVCLVRAGDGIPMAEWRPEHPCAVPVAAVSAAERFVPPCERGMPGMCGRSPQEALAGVRNCEMCDPPPSEPRAASRRPLDEAVTLLKAQLGAVMIEREHHGRMVYRDRNY